LQQARLLDLLRASGGTHNATPTIYQVEACEHENAALKTELSELKVIGQPLAWLGLHPAPMHACMGALPHSSTPRHASTPAWASVTLPHACVRPACLQVRQRLDTLEQSLQELTDLREPGTGYGALMQSQEVGAGWHSGAQGAGARA
jgi:hypothetical protein